MSHESPVTSHELLPTRFHIGLQRAASTYLYDLLTSHPDVALPRKGLGFYANKFDRGMDWYLAQFPAHGIRIDPSPIYFVRGQLAAPRIKAAVADAPPRFVLMLRNPIDYTTSRFLLHRRTGRLRRRFGTVPRDLPALLRAHPEYLDESRYADLLERSWLPLFALEGFHIVLFERFVADVPPSAAAILEFLGLRPHTMTATPSSRNATLRYPILHSVKSAIVARPRLRAALRGSGTVQRLYNRWLVARTPKLEPGTRAQLADLLAPDVERLRALLNDPLRPWRDFQ